MKCSSFAEAFSAWLPDNILLPHNISVIRVDNKIDPHFGQRVWSIWLCMLAVGRQKYTDNASFCRRSTSGATTRWNPRRSTIEMKSKPRSCGVPNKWLRHSFKFGPSRRYCSWWSQLSEANRKISVNWTNLEKKKLYQNEILKENRNGEARDLLYCATCSCSYSYSCSYSLIIRFDGPVGLKHVSQQNRIHEVVLEGRPKRQQQNQQ